MKTETKSMESPTSVANTLRRTDISTVHKAERLFIKLSQAIKKQVERLLAEEKTRKKRGLGRYIQYVQGQVRQALEEKTKHEHMILEKLTKLTTEIAHIYDIEELLDTSLRKLKEIFGADYVGILRPDEDDQGDYLFLYKEGGYPEGATEIRVRLPAEGTSVRLDQLGITARAFVTGEKVYAPDTKSDIGYVAARKHDNGSELALPLNMNGKKFGVLNIESDALDAFPKEEIRLLSMFAGLVSARLKAIDLMTVDEKTGLGNDRRLKQELEKKLRRVLDERKQPFGLIYLDLNRFKDINDTHGHNVGDDVLRTVAGVLNKNVKAADEVIRAGGDEFILIIDGDEIAVRSVLARINTAIEATAVDTPSGASIALSASIGTAMVENKNHPIPPARLNRHGIQELMKRITDVADSKMYEAKRTFSKETGRSALHPTENIEVVDIAKLVAGIEKQR